MAPNLGISTVKCRPIPQNNFLVSLSGFNEIRGDFIKQKFVPMMSKNTVLCAWGNAIKNNKRSFFLMILISNHSKYIKMAVTGDNERQQGETQGIMVLDRHFSCQGHQSPMCVQI